MDNLKRKLGNELFKSLLEKKAILIRDHPNGVEYPQQSIFFTQKKIFYSIPNSNFISYEAFVKTEVPEFLQVPFIQAYTLKSNFIRNYKF